MKPYRKAETLKFIGLQDRRRKLTDDQRAEILKIRQETGAGYRTIAKQFNVSRSLVRIICDPECAARVSAVMGLILYVVINEYYITLKMAELGLLGGKL